jgi:hypothetical protein
MVGLFLKLGGAGVVTKLDGSVLTLGSLFTLGAAAKSDGAELMVGLLLKLGACEQPNRMVQC